VAVTLGVHAYAIERDGSERPLVHVVRHSHGGFEYGYGGSGPADLARSILIDFFGLHASPDRLPVSDQEFKWQFIATPARRRTRWRSRGWRSPRGCVSSTRGRADEPAHRRRSSAARRADAPLRRRRRAAI